MTPAQDSRGTGRYHPAVAIGDDQTFDLLGRWRAGDNDALQALLGRDLEWIRSFISRHLGTRLRSFGDTDDFVQELSLRVLRDGPRFVLGNRDQFRSLLATIVLNVIRSQNRALNTLKRDADRQRAIGSDTVLYLDPPQRAVLRPDEKADVAEQEEWLRLGFLLLSSDDQAVLDLHWQGKPDAEIGAALGVVANTARMRRERATTRLTRTVLDLKSGRLQAVLEASVVGPEA